jgi:hypothetical protein
MATYVEFRLRSAHMAMSNLPMTALLPFVTWLLVNTLLKRFAPRLALSRTELLVVLGMVWVGGSFAGYTWITQWVGGLSAPRYFASPENRWRELVFDLLPWWMYPLDDRGVTEWFYVGLPEGAGVPWGAWLAPVFWALVAALSLLLMAVGIAVVFQRQWAEHERLTFPMAAVPLDLTSDFDGRGGWPWFVKDRLFWFGTGLVLFPHLWNIVGYFILGFPHIGLFDPYYGATGPRGYSVSRLFPDLSYRILPTVIGFTFLCDLNILFSLWFCYLVGLILLYGMGRTGFTVGLPNQTATPAQIGNLSAHGAMTFLVLWSVWIARRHLREVLRRAWRPDPSEAGATLVSYRTALLLVLLGGATLVGWLCRVGFSPGMAVAWLGFFWVGLFATMKYLAASGFGYMFPSWGSEMPEVFAGTAAMSESTVVGFRLVNWRILGGWRIPPAIPHVLKMTEPAQVGRGGLFTALLLAFLAGLLSAVVYTLHLCYSEGGASFQTWALEGGAVSTYNAAATAINEALRTLPDPGKMAVWVTGGALAAALSFLQTRYAWWPLHPIGLVLQFNGYLQLYALTIFITWLLKLLILRFGGIALYRRARPFFYGLIIGYVLSVGLSCLVDAIWFPEAGHYVHGY